MLEFRWIVTVALAISCQLLATFAGDAVPVLLLGGDYSVSLPSAENPLFKTSEMEFEKILMKKMGGTQPPILVFVRDNLCIEDLTKHKEGLSQFNYTSSPVYLPAVDSPLYAFENLSFYNYSTKVKPELISDGQLVVTRVTDLNAIFETYKTVRESSPNLITVLTGRSCSYGRSERTRRDTSVRDDTSKFLVSTDRVLLYSSEGLHLKVSQSEDFVQLNKSTSSTTDGAGTSESPLRLIMVFTVNATSVSKATLRFQFVVGPAGYYKCSTIEYEPDGKDVTLLSTNSEIVFPYNFSYHCSQNTVFFNNSVYLNITNMQVQVDATTFGDTYDCVGFTTIPIWAGIFVTAILALIMIWGLTMIIDIRTMDRFDDPKGKTITISAQE